MKNLNKILSIFLISNFYFSQENLKFNYNDEEFIVGQTKTIIYDFYPAGGKLPFPKYENEFDSLKIFLNKNPKVKIEIGIHTGLMANKEYNLHYSNWIGEKIINYLESNKFEIKKIKVIGYGESEPIVVDEEISNENKQFAIGQILDEDFMKSQIKTKNYQLIESLNRRVVIKIINF